MNKSTPNSLMFVILSLVLLAFTLQHCAEIGSPPGGEVDKTAPYMVGSDPADGSVSVSPGNEIVLYFSERIVEPTSRQTVLISPRSKEPPTVKFRGDRVVITLPDSFAVNTTYIVSASSLISDLRRNKLDSSLVIAFSTGQGIDSGQVSGFVTAGGTPQPNLKVGLYDWTDRPDSVVIDSLFPEYLSETNQTGFFSLQHLPQAEYRLVVFRDKNKDDRFAPSKEAFALPDRSIVLSEQLSIDSLQLELITQDTLLPEIISISYTPNHMLKIRLTKEIDTEYLRKNPSSALLTWKEDQVQVFPAFSFLEQFDETTSTLTFCFGTLRPGTYLMDLTYGIDRPALHLPDLEVVHVEDQVPPELIRFVPGRGSWFVDKVEIEAMFSEQLDTTKLTDVTFALFDSDETSVPLGMEWVDPVTIRLKPKELKADERYRLVMAEFELLDMGGQVVGDSLAEFVFGTYSTDSLGSISGDISIRIPSSESYPVIMTFSKIGGRDFPLEVDGFRFNIALPSGDYLLSGFLDSDLDGRKGNGSIYPYQLAETIATYPDTITVRARFETSEIHFELR